MKSFPAPLSHQVPVPGRDKELGSGLHETATHPSKSLSPFKLSYVNKRHVVINNKRYPREDQLNL